MQKRLRVQREIYNRTNPFKYNLSSVLKMYKCYVKMNTQREMGKRRSVDLLWHFSVEIISN